MDLTVYIESMVQVREILKNVTSFARIKKLCVKYKA